MKMIMIASLLSIGLITTFSSFAQTIAQPIEKPRPLDQLTPLTLQQQDQLTRQQRQVPPNLGQQPQTPINLGQQQSPLAAGTQQSAIPGLGQQQPNQENQPQRQ